MTRISGIDLPQDKKIDIALTYIYGIGRKNVKDILKLANVDTNKKAKNLTSDEVVRIQKSLETIPVEGSLRKIITENIKRLRQINTYRGLRHAAKLPSRGQRTRHNARTRRGRRMTVGALKKEDAAKLNTEKK